MQIVLITNNETADAKDAYRLEHVDGDAVQVLESVRDRVHAGWRLLSHPLGASIKMLHSPVVSVLMEPGRGAVDTESLAVIERALATLRAVLGERKQDRRHREAYALIDRNRMHCALRELNLYGKGEHNATRT